MGYLVISVKIGQRIKIGEEIEILISDFDAGKADVAIMAPKHLFIDRVPTYSEKKEHDSGNSNKNYPQHK